MRGVPGHLEVMGTASLRHQGGVLTGRTDRRINRVSLTPAERTKRARQAAYAMHAKNDPKATTAKARATFLQRFVDEVDPDRTLPEAERERRAECARKAYYAGLALRSSVARRRRSA